MVDTVYSVVRSIVLSKFVVDIPLFYYHINLRSSIVLCLFFWNLSVGVSVSLPTVSEVFFD